MSGQVINAKVAAYAAEIVAALDDLKARDCGFGEFYILGISLGFDGDDAGVSIRPDEFGGLEIVVDGNPR